MLHWVAVEPQVADLCPKWVRLAPNGTNLRIFFQIRWAKMYWIESRKKNPDLFYLGPNLVTLCQKILTVCLVVATMLTMSGDTLHVCCCTAVWLTARSRSTSWINTTKILWLYVVIIILRECTLQVTCISELFNTFSSIPKFHIADVWSPSVPI